jgi:hypothetical protein
MRVFYLGQGEPLFMKVPGKSAKKFDDWEPTKVGEEGIAIQNKERKLAKAWNKEGANEESPA